MLPSKVSFIGTGNVATRMAERLHELGIEVVQMCSRSGVPVSEFDPSRVDAVIVAVSDDAIAPVLNEVPGCDDVLWLHTAGSVGIDVFDSRKFPRRGVLYPLQTLLKTRTVDWAQVPLLVEGDPGAGELARLMSPSVAELDSSQRRRLHAAAVLTSNMAMYMWSLAQEITDRADLPFDMLKPLLDMTARRAQEMPPAQAMTGPARRGDVDTIRLHIKALPPAVAPVYEFLSQQILKKYHPDDSL